MTATRQFHEMYAYSKCSGCAFVLFSCQVLFVRLNTPVL
jgi:hypothetical protein